MNMVLINAEAQRAAIEARIAPRKHTGKACGRLDVSGETILLGLVGLAATVGIGYGCVCLVNLVQSCALFGARVAQALP
jgi:hypothetical protein